MTDRATPATLWEGRPASDWQAMLRLPALHVHDSIGSTSDAARELAQQGAAPGTVVLAEHQTQGRGRQGRPWTAPPASSLMFSLVLRPRMHDDCAPGTLPLRIGSAVARAVHHVAAIDARVKWPNDVVAGSAKLAGVLCEAVGLGGSDAFVIAGIGINVRQRADEWPDELRDVATSIDACAGRRTDRAALFQSVVDNVRHLFTGGIGAFDDDELLAFHARDALADAPVSVLDAAGTVHGVADGIDSDGALRVRTEHGVVRVTSGTVRRTGSPEPARA